MVKSIVYSSRSTIKLIETPKPVLNQTYTFQSWLMNLHNTSAPSPSSSSLSKQRNYSNDDYVLIKVHAVGLNPVDAKFLYGDKLPSFCLPWVKSVLNNKGVGIDFAGEIIETATENPSHLLSNPVNDQVNEKQNQQQPLQQNHNNLFKVGDEVFGVIPPPLGSLSEIIKVPTDCIYYKPTNLSYQQAATLPLVGLTILQIYQDYKAYLAVPNRNRKTHLLIVGASGGTGHMAVQIAKSYLFSNSSNNNNDIFVTGICSRKNEHYVRHQLGVDHVICYDYTNQTLLESLTETVTNYGYFDMVLDTVTSNEAHDAQFHYKQLVTPFLKNKKSKSVSYNQTSQHQPKSQQSLAFDATPTSTAVHKEKAGVSTITNDDDSTIDGIYITLGGSPYQWLLAHFKRFLSIHLFPKQQELFWVRFRHCHEYLHTLKELCESNQIQPAVTENEVFLMTETGVLEAFVHLMSRRTVGKIVIQVAGIHESAGNDNNQSSSSSNSSNRRSQLSSSDGNNTSVTE